MSRSALYRAIRAGEFDRIARGIYRPADAPAADLDRIEAATRRPEATICLTSALAHHDLTDAIPAALDIAIPRGTTDARHHVGHRLAPFRSRDVRARAHRDHDPRLRVTIGIYSPARCIADAFRLRGDVGYEIGRDALREWLRRGGKPAELMAIASKPPAVQESDPARIGAAVVRDGDEVFRQIQTAGPLHRRHRRAARPHRRASTRHALESFLDRLTRTPHADDFVLKGGILLGAYDVRRPTKDVDAEAVSADVSAEHVAQVVRDLSEVDVDDGLLVRPRLAERPGDP